MSMPAPSTGNAFAVNRGNGLATSEQAMHYQMPGQETTERKKQVAVSNLNVRSAETQGSNAENTLLLSKIPVADSGKRLTAFSRPVISDGQAGASTAKLLRQPTVEFFIDLLRMDQADFFGKNGEKIAQALLGVDIDKPMKGNITMLEAALFAKAQGTDCSTVAKTLIRMGARFDLVDPDLPRILKGAMEINNDDLVKSLISRSKGKNSEELHQALTYAVSKSEPELALAAIKSIGIIKSSLIDVTSLLSQAVALNNLELVIKIWLHTKPDINKPNFDGSTVLAYAATYMASPEILGFLLFEGAQVNGADTSPRSNAVAAALIGVSERTLANFDEEERKVLKMKKLETLETILDAENVSIDFDMKIPNGRSFTTLFDLAVKAGPEFVACLEKAQLRQASGRTGMSS